MWTGGWRTKTNPKTSPEQSAIFQHVQEINQTNVLTKFHDDYAKNVTSIVKTALPPPPPCSHVIQLTGTIFELNSHIKETNVLTKFHENWAQIEKCPAHWRPCFFTDLKTVPPTGGHVFQWTGNTFELN
ncbi:hypothetical protein DPMN_075942 [Dreissena polymorpha]|uniref:Uncharacterized protein n=1 Tax=Dreissena polymorpha TaxID=45954 RepID=A0A9D3YKK7_DREPO|nr:hypothetical protein DPMN_075942 [Dreissena polymorpha]